MTTSGPVVALCAASTNEVWFSQAASTEIQYVQFLAPVTYIQGYLGSFAALSMTCDAQRVVMAGTDSNMAGWVFPFATGSVWGGTDAFFAPTYRDNDTTAFLTVFTAGTETWVGRAQGFGSAALLGSTDGGWSADASVQFAGVDRYESGWGQTNGNFWVATSSAGQNFALRHFDRGTWTNFTAPAPGDLNAVTGTPSGEVWAVGQSGLVLRVVGNAAPVRLDAGAGLGWYGVYAASATDVFLAGGDATHGRVARWNGTGFDLTPVGTSALQSIHGTSATDVWAGDSTGGLWHLSP